MQTEAHTQAQDKSVAPPPRRVRGKLVFVSLAALLLAGTGLMISSARAAGPGGGDEAAEGMPMHRMQKILDKVGASPSQRDQIRAVWSGLRPQLKAERINHENIRQQMIAALTAPQINPGDVEKLRKQAMTSADKISSLITQGMLGSAQVLTPDQRKLAQQEIAKNAARHHWGPPAE